MSRIGRTAVVVAVLLLAVLAVPNVGSPVDGATIASQQAPPTATNNTTAQHVDPDSVSEPGDTEQVRQWLERRLLDRLQQSTIEIRQGEYERARESLGTEYESRLEQYVNVTGQTGQAEPTGEFRSIRENQSEFANTSRSYQQTYSEYEQAREQGNTTAAIRRARELETLAANATRLNRSLARTYEQLGNVTSADTAPIQRELANTTKNISSQQAMVRSQSLIETRLNVTTNETTVAFDDPMTISGTVETVDGAAVTNQSGTVVIGTRVYPVQTDRNGHFNVSYRPISLPVSATAVDVRYIPPLSSPYFGAVASTPVAVEQVTASLSTTVTPTTVGYGDTVALRTTVRVDRRTVPSVPVTATLARSNRSQFTNETGVAEVERQIRAVTPAGSQDVQVAHARDGLAIGPVETTVPLTVDSKATNMRLNATETAGDVRIRGQLRTRDGLGVVGQNLTATIGETTQTVQTNQSGYYRLTVSNVSTATETSLSAVPVAVRFNASGTNLEDSSATTTVALSSAGTVNTDPIAGLRELIAENVSMTLLLASVIGVSLIAGTTALLRQFWSDGPSKTDRPATELSDTIVSEVEPEQYLETAQHALSNGDINRATIAAYASIRNYYQQQADIDSSLTQREFLDACRTQHSETNQRLLVDICEAYEQLLFTGESSVEVASDAVDAATTLLADQG